MLWISHPRTATSCKNVHECGPSVNQVVPQASGSLIYSGTKKGNIGNFNFLWVTHEHVLTEYPWKYVQIYRATRFLFLANVFIFCFPMQSKTPFGSVWSFKAKYLFSWQGVVDLHWYNLHKTEHMQHVHDHWSQDHSSETHHGLNLPVAIHPYHDLWGTWLLSARLNLESVCLWSCCWKRANNVNKCPDSSHRKQRVQVTANRRTCFFQFVSPKHQNVQDV